MRNHNSSLSDYELLRRDRGGKVHLRCIHGVEFSAWIRGRGMINLMTCPCLRKMGGPIKHGESSPGKKTSEYKIWASMRQRCNDPGCIPYPSYGGRGISVCERWGSFQSFLEDMGRRPHGMSIERIDNNGNYEPGNCRWATMKEQANNRRSSISLTVNGETHLLQEWEKITGIKYSTLWHRLKRQGLSPEKVIEK